MPVITLPFFGEIDTEKLEDYYDVNAVIEGYDISIDLNFEEPQIDADCALNLQNFLNDLEHLLTLTRAYIRLDYDNGNEGDGVQFYFQFHKDESGEFELCQELHIDPDVENLDSELLKLLRPVRIGIYPNGSNYFGVFDYSFGNEITNYVLVVNVQEDGSLRDIIVES